MDISKIKVGSTSYNIKDASARASIESLQGSVNSLAGGQYFLGTTTTVMSDGKTGATVSIGGNDVDAVNGNIVIYGNKEFIFDGTKWYEFGDLSTLGSLAYQDTASASYTPAGSNAASAVTFTGQADGNFVTGFATEAVAPSFTEGAFTQGTLPSFTEGAFTPASLGTGFYSAGTAPSLGNASTGTFAQEGVKIRQGNANNDGEDAEMLVVEDASTSSAVTAQGTFSAGTLPTIDVTKFNGGSKAADTFSAGTLPSKAADTFSAGTAATLATAKAITAVGTGTAAAQIFTGATTTITVS